MKKSESLVATLLAIYAILLTISFALYAVIKEFNIDISLSTNHLIWTATLFAPIAVLMTYTVSKEQKNAENMSRYGEQIYKGFIKYFSILESCPLFFENKELISNKSEELDSHFNKLSILIVVYCEFLKYIRHEEKILDLQKLENQHLGLIRSMKKLTDYVEEQIWMHSLNEFAIRKGRMIDLMKKISKDLAKKFLYLGE